MQIEPIMISWTLNMTLCFFFFHFFFVVLFELNGFLFCLLEIVLINDESERYIYWFLREWILNIFWKFNKVQMVFV